MAKITWKIQALKEQNGHNDGPQKRVSHHTKQTTWSRKNDKET